MNPRPGFKNDADRARVQEWDAAHSAYYYVNTTTNPPTTTWTHPGQSAAPNQPYSPAPQVGGGSATDYMSAPPNTGTQPYASHDQTQTGSANQYGNSPNDPSLGGADGQRGAGSNMAINMVMGKLTGNKNSHGVSCAPLPETTSCHDLYFTTLSGLTTGWIRRPEPWIGRSLANGHRLARQHDGRGESYSVV